MPTARTLGTVLLLWVAASVPLTLVVARLLARNSWRYPVVVWFPRQRQRSGVQRSGARGTGEIAPPEQGDVRVVLPVTPPVAPADPLGACWSSWPGPASSAPRASAPPRPSAVCRDRLSRPRTW